MTRLYLKLYAAVLAALVLFALAAGALWQALGDEWPRRGFERAARLAQNALPPAEAPAEAQQAALERLTEGLRVDAALYDARGNRLAAVGRTLPPEAWTIALPDGRRLSAWTPRRGGRGPGFGFFTLLLVLAAIGAGAYPVVRRLTRRLERLQAGVESLGAGDLAARVPIEGKDEVARLAESFNRAAARIEALVGAHRDLLANASHELRTPLARIRMAVELAKSGVDPARRAELEQDVAELDALIDEILLASRLDAAPPLAREPVDLLALAAEECARYEAVELDGEPATVEGDPRLLRRLVRNLLENARRHGAPPVKVSVRPGELRVRDAGAPIPAAEREKLFEPFYRRPGAAATGSGLGLAIVQRIAHRHGGEARYDDGFVVTLPGSWTKPTG